MNVIHAQVAQTLVLFYALVGLWGVVLGLRRSPLDGAYRGALALVQGTTVLPILTGIVLLTMGGRPAQGDIHYLYGLALLVTLPLVHQYLQRGKVPPALAYGLGCLFMAGIAVRGITTGMGA